MSQYVNKDFLSRFLHYCVESESSKQYLTWCSLSAIAGSVGRRVWLDWGTETLYPNFYILLVGPPGGGRKGTAMSPMIKIMREADMYIAPSATTRERMIAILEDSMSSFQHGPELMTHCSMSIVSPELAVLLTQKQQNMLADLTDWYDCPDLWSYETKSSGSNIISGVCVNIIAATTPMQIHHVLPFEQVGTGLTSRIIFVFSHGKRKTVPLSTFPMSEAGKKLKSSLVKSLIALKGVAGGFKLSPEYLSLYTAWYTNMPESSPFDPLRFAPYWARRPTHLRKLSMLMALSRGAGVSAPLTLQAVDFTRARMLLKKTEKLMPQAFSSSGKRAMADFLYPVLEFITNQPNGCYDNDILRAFIRDLDPTTLDGILTTFIRIGAIRVVIKPLGKFIEFIPDKVPEDKIERKRERKLKGEKNEC